MLEHTREPVEAFRLAAHFRRRGAIAPRNGTPPTRRRGVPPSRVERVLRPGWAWTVWLAIVVVGPTACRAPIEPIVVHSGRVVVTNTSADAWSDVEVWVNDHYRAMAPTLAPGGVLDAPLSNFVAGFGQRFDVSRQRVTGVEVTARTAGGTETRLVWGEGRRR